MRWLTGPRPTGTTWGVPWPRGKVPAGASYALRHEGRDLPVQSWTTATWPDGSVKWSAHAVPALADASVAALADASVAALADASATVSLIPGEQTVAPDTPVTVAETDDTITVHTGVVHWELPRTGPVLVRTARRGGRVVMENARLTSLWQPSPTPDNGDGISRTTLHGHVERTVVEQAGPVRAVVRIDGRHTADGGADHTRDGRGPWLPFTVRLYFYAGADDVRIVHSVIWDGDADRDFLAGLALRADVPMPDELHDRHIRIAGPADDAHRPGFLTEAVRGITGLRRDPGQRFRAAQLAGRPCGPVEEWDGAVSKRLHLIPAWNDWTLDQASADGFTLRKRTSDGSAWVTIPSGTRAAGYAYVGGVSGGLGFGLRDFWKMHPTRLDVRGAATACATATIWMWSPSAETMDLRFYHDGLGQDTFAEQLEGLEITYEDYEPGFGDPHGIGRTHELTLRAVAGTPSNDELADHAAAVNDPPLLVAEPARLHAAGVFGDWAPADRSAPERAEIEDRLDFLFDFYLRQRQQRRWYGFWDYGDVMHTYDADRHQWRYDVGGYAWDNSELSPDLWLWYQFLRTGRADVFRFAEAMTRHTGEVDVYHAGRWAGLGSRHNVQHWGCSAKQLRISNAGYRRFYYYLTADERTGDLLDELADAERALLGVDATRKVRPDTYTPDPSALAIGLGTDWGALAAAWLTRWERYGDDPIGVTARDKLLRSMTGIGGLPQGFLTGEALLDLSTGRFDVSRDRIAVSHLSAVFGLAEMCAELIALTKGTELEAPGFERAWLDYCRLYLATPEEQAARLGAPLRGISLIQAHSRLTAYAAAATGDDDLARRAWKAFRHDVGDQINTNALQRRHTWTLDRIDGPSVLAPVDEAPFVSTNDAAQYGLAAIQLLALLPDDHEH
ncbi:Tat pathway signal sequence domain protein [Phytoactinopolyspora halotolerans]|uniref:Tat pathway signal sequence domain protein n=1 Tax=Phytoactinopolyspora halotolerans TaxID=1981512 RepID=A0A6L9SCW8_9ACTN|nr:Tat pathway signal sequence domain protein [Phytoactinopolyspora halotolerans]